MLLEERELGSMECRMQYLQKISKFKQCLSIKLSDTLTNLREQLIHIRTISSSLHELVAVLLVIAMRALHRYSVVVTQQTAHFLRNGENS